jgi:hypothetical protein
LARARWRSGHAGESRRHIHFHGCSGRALAVYGALQARFGERQQLVDESGHFLDLVEQGGDMRRPGVPGLLLEDSESELNAGYGSAEFVSNIAEELLLVFDEALQAGGHVVDLLTQMAELVAAARIHVRIEMTGGPSRRGGGSPSSGNRRMGSSLWRGGGGKGRPAVEVAWT